MVSYVLFSQVHGVSTFSSSLVSLVLRTDLIFQTGDPIFLICTQGINFNLQLFNTINDMFNLPRIIVVSLLEAEWTISIIDLTKNVAMSVNMLD